MVLDGYKIYQDEHLVSYIMHNHWGVHLKVNITVYVNYN